MKEDIKVGFSFTVASSISSVHSKHSGVVWNELQEASRSSWKWGDFSTMLSISELMAMADEFAQSYSSEFDSLLSSLSQKSDSCGYFCSE